MADLHNLALFTAASLLLLLLLALVMVVIVMGSSLIFTRINIVRNRK